MVLCEKCLNAPWSKKETIDFILQKQKRRYINLCVRARVEETDFLQNSHVTSLNCFTIEWQRTSVLQKLC